LPNLYEKVAGGTSSQFLKADGSVDGNLYALAYNNNQNKVLESNVSNSLHVIDRRNTVMLPTTFEDNTISTFFNLQSTPTNNWWSGIAVKGWSGEYGVWMLAGPAAGDNAGNRLYYKDGNHSNWATDWKGLAFLDDISNLGDVYFNGQNIYNDYGYWVIGLLRIGTADIGDKYISGEMIYRRSNGIYGNGSVRFNLIKKYSSTQMFAGVFYTGYGIDPDQDAPRLCTFTYQGVKWGGLCWRSAASLNSIKTIIYDNSSTDAPFYVLYYKSNIPDVTNPEINNSISVLGSDIDIQPVSTNGRFYTSADRIEINNITNGWSYTRYRTNGRYYDIGLSGTTAGMNGTGNFEIRSSGDNNDGIFVRYGSSAYGKLGVVSKNTNDCTISYYNSVSGSTYPTWTVGIGIRDKYSFDWWYYNQGYKMTLDNEGKLFVNVKGQGNPSCSLAIGDYDTGLNWHQDGYINFVSNAVNAGHWGSTEARFHNAYFRIPSGNDYSQLGIMVNGNGTANTIKPGIGFHQPGVFAGSIRMNDGSTFGLYAQGGSGLANLSLNGWYTNFGYINGDGIHLSSGWLRTVGATGWYNETYAGGMYMADGTWIRTHNGRKFYVDNAEVDAILTQGGFRSNGNSQVGLQIDGSESTRTIIYGKIGSTVNSVVARYAVNWYSEWARFDVHRGGGTDILKFSWKHNDTELMYLGMGGYFQVNGTIVSTGEVTAYSDIRLKTNIKPLDYKGRLAPKWFIKDNKPSIGFIAQEV